MSAMLGWGPTGRASGLKGTGYKQVNLPTMNQDQMGLTQLLHSLIGGQSGGLAQGLAGLGRIASGDQSQFEKMEAPALRQFGALQGNIASRFSGMGSGARNSSGFQNTLGEAGASLAENLAAKRMDYQNQALQQLLGLSESLLNRPTFQSGFVPKQKKSHWWESLLPIAGSFASSGASKLMGGF